MLHVFLVITPNVLMLDYAGPAEALRMARDMGAPLELQACVPVTEVPTSLGTRLAGLLPLPASLPANSLGWSRATATSARTTPATPRSRWCTGCERSRRPEPG